MYETHDRCFKKRKMIKKERCHDWLHILMESTQKQRRFIEHPRHVDTMLKHNSTVLIMKRIMFEYFYEYRSPEFEKMNFVRKHAGPRQEDGHQSGLRTASSRSSGWRD